MGFDSLNPFFDDYGIQEIDNAFLNKTNAALEFPDFVEEIQKLAEARNFLVAHIKPLVTSLESMGQGASDSSDEASEMIQHLKSTKGHAFVSGEAGTGKSRLLSKLVESLQDVSLAVVAPTGVAALNVNGETIHSFFGLKIGVLIFDLAWIKRLSDKHVEKLAKLDLLIIDEVSMVGPDTIDVIDAVLRHAKKCQEPFGGIRVVMFGDLMQLQPVAPQQPEVKAALAERYGHYWWFKAKAWELAELEVLKLTEVKRQEDRRLVEALSRIRLGYQRDEDLKYLNSRVNAPLRKGASPIRLVKTNAKVTEFNDKKMYELSGSPREFIGIETRVVKDDQLVVGEWPVDRSVTLKVGAQVMFAKNDEILRVTDSDGSEKRRWVNGTLGTVSAFTNDGVMVRVGTDAPIEVRPVTWELIKHQIAEVGDERTQKKKQKLVPVVVATYTQIPLKPAWALTIHKAQGKTLDDVVIDLSGSFNNPGQAYVALSRTRELEGIVLVEPLTAAQIKVDGEARYFMDTRKIVTMGGR